MVLQLGAGLWLTWYGLHWQYFDLEFFGLALVVSYPLIWAHLAPLISIFGLPFQIKPIGKRLLCRLLERQVRQLRARHKFAVVAVAGSVGKTSTKLAIADALSAARRVRYQAGNYNDRLTVPLILFGHDQPGLYNILAWLRILSANRKIIRQDYPYDVAVVELGTDGVGQLRHFAYLQPELGVLVSIAPEHMEQFKTMDAVASEELSLFDFCQRVLVNTDDVDAQYLESREYVSYGGHGATYVLKSVRPSQKLGSQRVTFALADRTVSTKIQLIGQHGAKVALAAAATACEMALSQEDVEVALKQLKPFAGRMQILPGIKKATLIDDTYNASPIAVAAALDVLQSTDAPQRIAVLGSMNELGETSPEAHRQAGALCDPQKLDLVVTIGRDAKEYLARVAGERGCVVHTFLNPKEAGEFVAEHIQEKALVLFKGSQNRVFAEEALKVVLDNPADADKLVRQSAGWMKVKRRQFRGL
jgi:UDP-N-acetylmuramoyl-tripeptide--D-alanyl-D-alanine ligase